jgi:hypothetical protein
MYGRWELETCSEDTYLTAGGGELFVFDFAQVLGELNDIPCRPRLKGFSSRPNTQSGYVNRLAASV